MPSVMRYSGVVNVFIDIAGVSDGRTRGRVFVRGRTRKPISPRIPALTAERSTSDRHHQICTTAVGLSPSAESLWVFGELRLNGEAQPRKTPLVRQALAPMGDSGEYIDFVSGGEGIPAVSPVPHRKIVFLLFHFIDNVLDFV